jgi:hypothetical protein
MDKNKFWLGGRLFNTTSPRLGAAMQQKACAPTQHKAHPQDGHPNAMHRHVYKMGAQTKNRSATKTSTQGSTRLKDELEDG